MSALPQVIEGRGRPERDLIDRIAGALPPEIRADYYREMAYLRVLPESDEMLRILRTMQFLAVLIQQAPAEVAGERQRLELLLNDNLNRVQATLEYQRQVSDRITRLPEELSNAIAPGAIAQGISDDLRQRFAGIPETARSLAAISKQMNEAVAEFDQTAAHLTGSYTGVAESARKALDQMRASIMQATAASNAAARDLTKRFASIHRWAIAALCGAALVTGFAMGVSFHEWGNSVAPVMKGAAKVESPSTPSKTQARRRGER